ncbi:hypothetical protein GCM10009736_80170 [Actinomadura bangladeshensis]
MNNATNPGSGWLFPDGRARPPLSLGALLKQMRALGLKRPGFGRGSRLWL